MSHSLRHLSWIFSILLHLTVLIGGAYVSTGPNIKLNLNKRMYEVDLVGPPHKGKPGMRSTPRQEVKAAPQKTPPKEAPSVKAAEVPKKPEKKVVPTETAKALPKTVNATVAEAPPEEPKKAAPKKQPPEKKEPKKEEPKKEAKETKPKKPKEPTREEILAQALGEASKTAKQGAAKEGSAKSTAKSGSKDALAAALADIGREVSGRGTSGDGTAGDGPGEGVSSGSLEQFYTTKVIRAIRENWRFPRFSNVVLVAGVELRLSRAGDILASRLVTSSGRSDFDASVMRAVEDTRKLPPLPETLPTVLVINFYNTENQ